MALFKFTKRILENKPIQFFNHGNMVRAFTYVDDIVLGVIHVIDRPAQADPNWNSAAPTRATSNGPYRIYNIGNNRPIQLKRYIEVLEKCLGKKAATEVLPIQAGDVAATVADVSALEQAVAFGPTTPIEISVARFVEWYRTYYSV